MRSFQLEYEVQYENTTPELSYSMEEGEIERIPAADPTQSLPTPFGTPVRPERTHYPDQNGTSNGASSSTDDTAKIVQPEPTPVLLRKIDHVSAMPFGLCLSTLTEFCLQRYSLHLLMYFAHWISLYLEQSSPPVYTITETHARWMFALLSRVDDYLTADEMSTLRSLARGCMGLIKDILQRRPGAAPGVELDVNVIAETSCWLVIAAVVGHWGQRDLWQDAESMLADVESSSVASTPS